MELVETNEVAWRPTFATSKQIDARRKAHDRRRATSSTRGL